MNQYRWQRYQHQVDSSLVFIRYSPGEYLVTHVSCLLTKANEIKGQCFVRIHQRQIHRRENVRFH